MKRKMIYKSTLAVLGFITIAAITGCTMSHEAAKRAPVAKSPSLYRVIKPGARDISIVPNIKGEYEVLPAESVLVQVNTGYLADFEVDVDGNTLALAVNPARQHELESQDMGYYVTSLNKDLSTADDANWDVTVYPPPSKRKAGAFNINIRTVSVNPKYTGSEKVSAPLTIPLVSGGEKGEEVTRAEMH